MEEIETVKKLEEFFRLLPGVGIKTAERLAYATLELSKEERNEMVSALNECNDTLKQCPNCSLFYVDRCPICSDEKRDHHTLLVVSSIKDIYALERTKGYKGIYFTLKGTLSPLHNRLPEDIGMPELLKRVEEEHIKEIILALPTDMEGETTAQYILHMFKDNQDVTLSRLAYGLPIGTNLEYLDDMTIAQSLKGRVKLQGEDK